MVTGQESMTITNRINILSHKVLSVQVSLNGLSFCILDTTTQTIVFLKEHLFTSQKNPFEVEKLLLETFQTTPLLQEEFKKVNLIHHNNMCTFVPKDLYDDQHLGDYLKFNTKIFESDFIATDEILLKHIMAVYVPFVNINNYFFDLFGSFEYQHSATILIQSLLQHTTTTKLYCNVASNAFELVFIKDGSFQLYNSFEYTSTEDFIYYILFTIEQLQLNTETIIFELMGAIAQNDELYTSIYQYIRHVSFTNHIPTLATDNSVHLKHAHNHFSLLNSF